MPRNNTSNNQLDRSLGNKVELSCTLGNVAKPDNAAAAHKDFLWLLDLQKPACQVRRSQTGLFSMPESEVIM